MIPQFEKTVLIHSNAENAWNTSRDFKRMKQWMGDAEMELDKKTDWEANNAGIISGLHHLKTENRGIVFLFEPCRTLPYTRVRSRSRPAGALPLKRSEYLLNNKLNS